MNDILHLESTSPPVCVNVRRGYDGRSLKLDMINLNSSSSWFHSDELEEQDGTQTVGQSLSSPSPSP